MAQLPQAARSLNDLSSGIAAGLGFALMQSVLMYGAVISASKGEASLHLDTCPQMSLYLLQCECEVAGCLRSLPQ